MDSSPSLPVPLSSAAAVASPAPRAPRLNRRGVLPGFRGTLTWTLVYLGLLVLVPLGALVLRASRLGLGALWATVTTPRALAAYKLSLGASLTGALLCVAVGLIVAWVLARYRFPGRGLVDALVDLPFALPTAVAGIALTTLYAPQGWIGRWFAAHDIQIAFARPGVVLALAFVGLPFVVRTVQPVLLELDPAVEEAAAVLGASRWQTFTRVLLPTLVPPLLTGFALAFARALGEYGSIVFISGNMPMKTEIVPLLIVTKLEQYDYGGATALAVGMLILSFTLLLGINLLQAWTRRAGAAPGRSIGKAHRAEAPALAKERQGPGPSQSRGQKRIAVSEPAPIRWLLTAAALVLLGGFVVLPLITVFVEAFAKGPGTYLEALAHPETRSAIRLTLLTAGIAVPLNVVFGLTAAWLLAKYRFSGRNLLVTLIDLPFSVSPVISGLIFVLLFGAQGLCGDLLAVHDIRILFAVPGIVLATTFVTLPFVAREVLPLMESQGSDEEEAALTLGARGPQLWWRVTLPKIRWGLVYGIILCNARAMGEFGAVSVVSGHIRGETNTMPLQIEILYNEYNFVGAFAVASLLALLALGTLAARRLLEARTTAARPAQPGRPS